MKSVLKYIIALLAIVTFSSVAMAETPASVLKKVSSKITSGKGLSCTFSVSGNGSQSASGTLTSSGSKFSIISNASSVWFDGKTMWTLNPSTQEVTVTEPTQSEIAESNPLTYITGYSSQYNLYYSKRKEAGRYLVVLNPKTSGTGVKAVEIAVNSKTYNPTRIIIRFDDDRRSTINISKLNYNASVSSSSFTYPASKYKGYEIVDLR